jgi:type IV pilus assembly protein PilC
MNEKLHQKLRQANNIRKNPNDDFIYGIHEEINPGITGKLENYLIERQKVTLKEKAFFFHLFSVLLNSGLTSIQSIRILSRKTKNQKFKRILNTINHDVEQGQSLSNSMNKFPETFTTAEIGVVKSGEAIGALDTMLTKLAKQTEDQNNLITQLKGSLTYPIIVLIILMISTVVMFGFVIPKLVELFVDNNIAIPTVTKILLLLSVGVRDYWGLGLIILIIATLIGSAYIQSEEGKFNWDLYKLKLPLYGSIVRKVYIVRFMSTLGILLDAGVPLHQTFKIITQVIDNEVYKLKAFELMGKVQAGEKISTNLATTPFLFPETVSKIVEIGEQSATLSSMSEKISKQYLGEVEYSLKNLTSVIGPIVIVIVGAFVAIFALAILSPVFQLSEGIV